MKRILMISMLLVSLVGIGSAQKDNPRPLVSQIAGNAPDEIKKEILDVDEQHRHAIKTRDVAALNRILADGWAYTNERGEVLTKAQWIANVAHRKLVMDTIVHDDFRMDMFGNDIVTVMGRSTSTLHYKGKVSNGPRRFGLIWMKMDGQWKLIAHYVNLIPKD